MYDFLKFFDKKRRTYPMHLSVEYSKLCDWTIRIWKKGCDEDGGDLEIVYVQHCDMEYVFACAHTALKEFLLEYEGGY